MKLKIDFQEWWLLKLLKSIKVLFKGIICKLESVAMNISSPIYTSVVLYELYLNAHCNWLVELISRIDYSNWLLDLITQIDYLNWLLNLASILASISN